MERDLLFHVLLVSIMKDLLDACGKQDLHRIRRILSTNKRIHVDTLSQALVSSSRIGHVEAMNLLLESKADIHYKNDNALRETCQYGKIRAVQILIANKADVNIDDGQCLITASEFRNSELTKILVSAKADVNVREGRALVGYFGEGPIDMVKFLLDNRADPNMHEGSTLVPAALYGRLDILDLLFQAGVKPDRIPVSSRFNIFLYSPIPIIMDLFSRRGIDINHDNKRILRCMLRQEAGESTALPHICAMKYYTSSSRTSSHIRHKICQLIYYGADYTGIDGIRPHHLRPRQEAILPYLHDRLVRYVKQTESDLLDMRKIMWHIITF